METRFDLINYFIRERGFRSFLEIGTDAGDTFRAVDCPRKVSVDPNADATFRMTSDQFFDSNREKFDIVFVDGFHEWHQAHRDATNALRCLNKGGVVVMHDCAPTSAECARHLEIYERPTGPWCGDVWVAFLKLRQELPFLTYVWNHDWGCGVIDTAKAPANLPEPLEDLDFYDLTFSDFLKHPERMNFVDEPIG